MKQICEEEKCTGCYACLNVCPNNSIRMMEDKYGFLFPQIDQARCVDCGMCKKICPSLNLVEYREPIGVYAAINKRKVDYITSTSGGIATLFARTILSEQGVVYGVAVEDGFNVKHVRVEKQEDIEQIKGSKYVQSEIGDNFRKIKNDLLSGRKVFFVGTPCQVAGLKAYLRKDYAQLITCDIVCHGVPSVRYLKEHIKGISKLNRASAISFRDKEGYYLTLYDEERILYRKKNFYDVYCMGFLKGLICRSSCYTCKYAQANRVGDITLGDFWGFDSDKEPFPVQITEGLSLVMINTQKGQKMFDTCSSDMVFQKRDINEAVKGNKQLRNPSKINKKYQRFRNDYLKFGFKRAAKRALWKEQVVYILIDWLREKKEFYNINNKGD